MTPAELVERWRDMKAGEASSGGFDRRLLAADAPVSLYACVFWPEGRSGLLLEGESAQRPTDRRIPKCRGVRVVHRTSAATPPRTELQIILEDERLVDIFAVLSLDLVEVARSEQTAASALRRCIDRLSMWQGLFERIPGQGLSDDEQRGLFGELAILEWLCREVLDPLDAVSAWTGPEPKNQDFIHGGIGIEVKSSLAKRHSRLTISNEKQLDERMHELLLLAYIRLDESAAMGLSLPDMVARCREAVRHDPPAAQLLEDRLVDAKYLDIHAPTYVQNKWQAAAPRFFEVRDSFPRLTEANLPAGVGDIRYSIIADDLGEFIVDCTIAVQRLRGGN